MSVFEALADPTRRQIVELLAEGERSAGEIASAFPVSRPGISRHLRVLRDAGLASSESRGQQRLYRLNDNGLAEAEEWLASRRRDWDRRLDALERHLRRKD
jgi:DNA-binding transcriptional ArsR family regulator